MTDDLAALRAHNAAAEQRKLDVERVTQAARLMRQACALLERVPSNPRAREAAEQLASACETLARFDPLNPIGGMP